MADQSFKRDSIVDLAAWSSVIVFACREWSLWVVGSNPAGVRGSILNKVKLKRLTGTWLRLQHIYF
jgi:hypothetical protein